MDVPLSMFISMARSVQSACFSQSSKKAKPGLAMLASVLFLKMKGTFSNPATLLCNSTSVSNSRLEVRSKPKINLSVCIKMKVFVVTKVVWSSQLTSVIQCGCVRPMFGYLFLASSTQWTTEARHVLQATFITTSMFILILRSPCFPCVGGGLSCHAIYLGFSDELRKCGLKKLWESHLCNIFKKLDRLSMPGREGECAGPFTPFLPSFLPSPTHPPLSLSPPRGRSAGLLHSGLEWRLIVAVTKSRATERYSLPKLCD